MKLKQLCFYFFFLLLLLSTVNNASAQSASEPSILLVEITDTINQATVEIMQESLQEAENRNAEAVFLLLDTPGGGLQQTFDIADLIKESSIPIVGFVYPSGSAAWSAGTFILMSCHAAAMTDHTIIGSAQPVEVTVEGTRPVNDSKTINALVSWLQERAAIYGRNTSFVKQFITKNLNVNETQALQSEVIEFIAADTESLAADLDGHMVITGEGNVTLATAGVETVYYTPSIKIQIQKFISNPVLTSLLFMLGIFALIFGISSPGYGAEVFGVVAILLSLIGSGFTLSALSIIFIIMGCVLLLIEVFATPGFGVIGIGGIICLIVGSIFLVPTYSTRGWMISMDLINTIIIVLAVVGILMGIFFGFLLYKVLQIRRKKAAIGVFTGETGRTIDDLIPGKSGYIRYKGEYWTATSNEFIKANTKVVIVDKENESLLVKPYEKSKSKD